MRQDSTRDVRSRMHTHDRGIALPRRPAVSTASHLAADQALKRLASHSLLFGAAVSHDTRHACICPQCCQNIALRPTAERSINPIQSIVGFSEITRAKCAETVGANATGLHWQRRDAPLRDLNIGDNGKMFGPRVGPATGRKGTIANLRRAAQNGRLLSASYRRSRPVLTFAYSRPMFATQRPSRNDVRPSRAGALRS
jgi:hypothetical protein